MQVVIDIPEEQYEYLSKIADAGQEPLGYFERVIMRGTPLPKGHGRLKDVDVIIDALGCSDRDIYAKECIEEDATTIIEPYKEESEEV
jgi:hypothetical protein